MSHQVAAMSAIRISADHPNAPITIDAEDNELPLSLELPTWLVLTASGPALKLAHLLVLLHRQPPADRPVTRELLAALLGKSVDRVDAYAKELATAGWLTVTRRRANGWQVPNEYRYRHSPPAGHARTVGDLMAVVDARQSTPVDNHKPAGQPVAAKTRPRSRTDAATTPAAPQNPRSERSRISAATQPQKCGPYKELTYCSYSSSIDRATEESPAKQPTEPSDAARELVRTLDYGKKHSPPSMADVEQLAGLVDVATGQGLTLAEIQRHCQKAIGRCEHAVVPYLVGALAADRLPAPRQPSRPAEGTLPPVCGECDAQPGEGKQARVVWLDYDREDSALCPRCHPDAVPAVGCG